MFWQKYFFRFPLFPRAYIICAKVEKAGKAIRAFFISASNGSCFNREQDRLSPSDALAKEGATTIWSCSQHLRTLRPTLVLNADLGGWLPRPRHEPLSPEAPPRLARDVNLSRPRREPLSPEAHDSLARDNAVPRPRQRRASPEAASADRRALRCGKRRAALDFSAAVLIYCWRSVERWQTLP